MELKMNQYQLHEKIGFNYEELKAELQAKVSMYETLVYTEDTIKEAKADKAKLNKLKKALNDERIRLQKEYLKPFEDFKAKIDELICVIDKPVAVIDKQVKDFEEHEKAEKLEKIKELWESIEHPSEMTFEHVFEGKFLNKSCPMSTVEQYIKNSVERFKNDIATLQSLPEFSFEAIEVYKQTLDMHKAISEGKRLSDIQKRKEEQARLAAEREAELERQKKEADFAKCMNPPEPPEEQHMLPPAKEQAAEPQRTWLGFKALLTVEDAQQLANFFAARGIEYERIMF